MCQGGREWPIVPQAADRPRKMRTETTVRFSGAEVTGGADKGSFSGEAESEPG